MTPYPGGEENTLVIKKPIMDLKNCSTAIFVKDIERSKTFYRDVLAIPVSLDFGKNVILACGLTIWEINDSHIITATLGTDGIRNETVNRFELSFETEDLEGVSRALEDHGVTLVHGIHEEPWGQRTIRFFDPDRHLIEAGESMKQFVTRFYRQGMTQEEVAHRTSVPVEEVKRLVGEVS